MNSKKDLEEAIKEKVTPLLEETMEKHWGLSIPKLETNITDKLKNPQLNIYIPQHVTFSTAKKKFKSEFLRRELRLHQGNVSNLAKTLEVDRRSIHRAMKDLEITAIRASDKEQDAKERFQEEVVDKTIRSALEQYAQLIQPQQMQKMYQEVPVLSRNIAKFLPHQDLTWKDAEREFEKQFLQHSLEEGKWKISQVAASLKIRPETLHRKIKRMGLRSGKQV